MATLQQTECLSFYGPCQLEIQPRPTERAYYVAVYDMNQPPRLVIKWQIDHLRGYGSNESVMKIQTGRLAKCVQLICYDIVYVCICVYFTFLCVPSNQM